MTDTFSTDAAAIERQLTLEEDCRTRGLNNHRRRLEHERAKGRGHAFLPAGKLLIEKVLNEVADSISEAFQQQGGGKRHSALPLLHGAETAMLAHVTLAIALGAAEDGTNVQTVFESIGKTVDENRLAGAFKEAASSASYAGWRRAGRKRFANSNVRQRHLDAIAENVSGATRWTPAERIRVGEFLLNHLPEELFLVKKATGRDMLRLRLTPAARELLAQWSNKMARASRWPMLAPPAPWVTASAGGYYSSRNKLWVVKERRSFIGLHGHLKEDHPVLTAINHLQSTPWRVNTRVHDVLKKLVYEGGGVAKLPHWDDIEVDKVAPRLEPPYTPEELQARKARRRDLHARNKQHQARRRALRETLAIAAWFRDEPRFWCPWQLDHRGRCYPMNGGLSPIGTDIQRGLMEFAEGAPWTQDGVDWMFIHLANMWGHGEEKMPLRARQRWAILHADEIKAAARDPYGNDWWMDADEPWQFLAGCFAYLDWTEGKPCHLPVAIDASCSGLQHYAAMTGDAEDAKQVNLIAGEPRHDMYQLVATEVQQRVDMLAKRDNRAKAWAKDRVSRAIVKQAVMAKPYGVRARGIKKGLNEVLEELDADMPVGQRYLHGAVENLEASRFLAEVLLKAVDGRLQSATSAQRYIARVARKAVARSREAAAASVDAVMERRFPGQPRDLAEALWSNPLTIRSPAGPIQWFTPDGFRVVQPDRWDGDDADTRLDVTVFGRTTKVTVRGVKPTGPRGPNAGAAPANFVHSMDGSHVRSVARMARAAGIPMASIHDCFVCRATDMAELRAIVWACFCGQYEGDVLGKLRADMGVEGVEAPRVGTLKLDPEVVPEFAFA